MCQKSGIGIIIGCSVIIGNRLGIEKYENEWYYRLGRISFDVKCEFTVGDSFSEEKNNDDIDEIIKLLLYKEKRASQLIYDYVNHGSNIRITGEHSCDPQFKTVQVCNLELKLTNKLFELLTSDNDTTHIDSLCLSFLREAASIQPILIKSAIKI